ncbi:MAG: hypothetical protein M3O50_21885 [Myxococcota bacterium]|nr:hypothetical protein [Myxococcota bacterium]
MKVLFYATVAVSGWRAAKYFLGRLFSRECDDEAGSIPFRTAASRDIA